MLGTILLSLFIVILITIIVIEVRNERRYQAKRRQKQEGVSPVVPKPQVLKKETPLKEKKVLPSCIYPEFTHQRLVDMGLSDEEALSFVQELIPQLETQIPLIDAALAEKDLPKVERLTHSIKGSATNLGTGGVADLLVECNTYLKSGTDIDITTAYCESLKSYTQDLKTQYT